MRSLEQKYLESLSKLYPTIAKASTEIINLEAILNLPKGTEHFLTDIHGEYEAFSHVLRNGSGSVRRKINEVFGNSLTERDKQDLASLVYYPKERIRLVKRTEVNMEDWYRINLFRLVELAKVSASKYTRSKVRKALPKDFSYVIEELINEKADKIDKVEYYNKIVTTIVRLGRSEEFIRALANLIQRLVIDHLHIVGDIYDRGPGPHFIMDMLKTYHSVDIQWGNHDVLWMGAAAGQRGCIANVIRICARYGNLDILEDGYGINLLPLAAFALKVYGNDPCTCFALKGAQHVDKEMNLRMHKAISIIQFKVEGQVIARNPQFGIEDRNLLHHINFETGMIEIDGKEYKMLDMNLPTVDPKNPYALTEEEEEIMERLEKAFMNCEKLQDHMRFLLTKGGLYKVYNGNLLYHGCVPLTEEGELKTVQVFGKEYSGKQLYEVLESYVRKGFYAQDEVEKKRGQDMMWYIWLHPDSPLFGKDKMATFERYFLAEKETHKETKNPYYYLLENETVVNRIIEAFGLPSDGAHIINGHVPVKRKNGESPIKCGGKLLVIDGGFSKAYQKETGIAGYTLIYNSYGLRLVAHEAFESRELAIQKGSDIHSETMVVTRVSHRRLVADTDAGREMKEQVRDLEVLLEAYRNGTINERS